MALVSDHDRDSRSASAVTHPRSASQDGVRGSAPESHNPDGDGADTRFDRLLVEVEKALDGLKAQDIQVIDVRGKTSIADALVVASGTSNRHVASMADEVSRKAKALGVQPLGVEGTAAPAEWVLVDLGDIIVHLMLPRVRAYYGLERLWLTEASDTVSDPANSADEGWVEDDSGEAMPADHWTARVERRRRYRD